jgi:hypothetical protein
VPQKEVIWTVKRSTTNHFATAHIPAAEREYAVIASLTTEEAVSYRHVTSPLILKRAMTGLSTILSGYTNKGGFAGINGYNQ